MNWRALIDKYGSRALGIYLFLSFGAWCVWETVRIYREGRLNYVEISFAMQNLVMVSLFLARLPQKAMDRSVIHQAVALAAFCSGAAFYGQEPTGGATARQISNIVIFASNVLGLLTLVNLGRSFGILIALREVRTDFLYSVVRHPMYGTDILLRIGYVISHLNPFTIILFILSSGCYVYRAMLEEKFLSQQEEYRKYMDRVRYRFIPHIF